jgi:hypothetical protein
VAAAVGSQSFLITKLTSSRTRKERKDRVAQNQTHQRSMGEEKDEKAKSEEDKKNTA